MTPLVMIPLVQYTTNTLQLKIDRTEEVHTNMSKQNFTAAAKARFWMTKDNYYSKNIVLGDCNFIVTHCSCTCSRYTSRTFALQK